MSQRSWVSQRTVDFQARAFEFRRGDVSFATKSSLRHDGMSRGSFECRHERIMFLGFQSGVVSPVGPEADTFFSSRMVSPDSPHGLPRLDGHRRTRLRSWPACQDGSAGARRGRRLDFFDGRRTGWSRAWDERGTVRAACVHFQQCWRGQAGEGAGRGDGDGRGMANRDRIAGDLSSICGLFSPPAALARASRTSKQTHAWPDRPLRGRAKAELGRNSKQPIGATTPRRPLEARASSPLPHPHVPSPRNRNAPAIVVPPTVFVFVGDYCSTKLVLLPRRQFKRANVATPTVFARL